MPPNSEIEKLERRWKENPKGTVFAPYAEVLRKNGDHLEARDVLRQGLELHPDHIPGNIVLGRCCLDLREDGPAEAAFTHVLDLDAENVIALKALADITERQGRLMEAREWLSRLISVDPSNEEARDQLERVDSAREAAAAAITAPLEEQSPPSLAAEPRGSDTTATVEVVTRPFVPQPGLTVEVAAGEVSDTPAAVDDAVDAALDRFSPPAARTVELEPTRPAAHLHGLDDADTVPVLPVLPRESAPIADLESVELDLTEATRDLEAGSLSGLVMDEPFAPPPPPSAVEPPDVFALDTPEPAPLELRPAGSSEFHTPDDSAALLELASSASEFQVPDASSELTLAGSAGSEYQTPSGSEELLRRVEESPEPELEALPSAELELEPEPLPSQPAPIAAPPPFVPSGPVTTGFAAITLMPTEELSTSAPLPPAQPPMPEAAAVEDEPPAVSVVDQLAEASAPVAAPAGLAPPAMDEPTPEPASEAPGRPSGLKLIFPEDTAEPEAPRVRRISQEVHAVPPEPAASAVPEPGHGEPEPVLTESMAELYARQGHLAEALNVYRTLLAQQPNDSRLAERVRQLEQQRATGSRRLSYVAMDTGGESVESFFRGLAGARPGGGGAGGEEVDGGGAPTRPARDPLSLSAIFGEEHAPAPAPKPSEPAQRPATPDAFSFDQFFGGPAPATSSTGPRQAMPSDEDLDQFQHWLKSLKR